MNLPLLSDTPYSIPFSGTQDSLQNYQTQLEISDWSAQSRAVTQLSEADFGPPKTHDRKLVQAVLNVSLGKKYKQEAKLETKFLQRRKTIENIDEEEGSGRGLSFSQQ